MRNETFAKPVAQMRGLFTLYHFSHDGHVVTLFECDPAAARSTFTLSISS